MRPALLLWIAAALAACGSKSSEGAEGAKGSEGSGAEAAPGSARAAAPAEPEAPAPPPPAGALPDACAAYRATVERLAGCGDALPQATRDALRTHFERQWTDWEELPEADRRLLASICQRSAETVQAAAAAACGW